MTTRRDIAAQRLAGQRLGGPQLESIEAVVRWLGAVQAQEYGVAKRSLGQRAAGLTDAAVDGALADGRILRTHAAPVERDEALIELVRRFFESHGPATANDFARWSSLTVGDARRGLDALGAKLERVVVEERKYWAPAHPHAPIPARPR